MTWIYEQPGWPSFCWDDSALVAKLAEVRHRQGRLLGRMEALGFDLRREASLATLTDDVLKSSAIEGEVLNRAEVRSSLARRLGINIGGLVPSPRHVDGIVEVMLDATQNFEKPLTTERLCGWHAALFPTGHSGIEKITVGAWRTDVSGEMQVVSGAMGREQVHFIAPSASRLVDEMASFIAWFETSSTIDPVLKAAIAHFWFVTIHPFEDGNGRLARGIADMALARADCCPDRYYSMSRQIETMRKSYYQQLEMQQRSDLDITRWLEWFLDCIGLAIDDAGKTLAVVIYKSQLWDKVNQQGVNERQRLVLNRMLDGFKGNLNSSKYSKLAKCSSDTALRDIRELLNRSILIQNTGGGRSTSYRLATIDELRG